MKVIKVSDLHELLERNNYMVNAHQCESLPSFEIEFKPQSVTVSYTLLVDAYSEDNAFEKAEEKIRTGTVPYDYSCVTKIDD